MGKWRLRLICCGRDDGELFFDTSEKADKAREEYTSGVTVAPHGYSASEAESGHRRAAIKDYVEADRDQGRCPHCEKERAHADALAEALRSIVDEAGLEFSDPRVSYETWQLDPGVIKRGRAVLAAHDARRK